MKKVITYITVVILAVLTFLPSIPAAAMHYESWTPGSYRYVYLDGKKYRPASKADLYKLGLESERAFGIDLDESHDSKVCLVLGLDTYKESLFNATELYFPAIEKRTSYDDSIMSDDLNVIFTDNYRDLETGIGKAKGKDVCAFKLSRVRTYETKNGGQYYDIYRKVGNEDWQHVAYVLDSENTYRYRKYEDNYASECRFESTLYFDDIPDNVAIYGEEVQYKVRLVRTNKKAKITKKSDFSPVLTYKITPDTTGKYALNLKSHYSIQNTVNGYPYNDVYNVGYTKAPAYDVTYTLSITSQPLIDAFAGDSEWSFTKPTGNEVLISKTLKDGTVLYESFDIKTYDYGKTLFSTPQKNIDEIMSTYEPYTLNSYTLDWRGNIRFNKDVIGIMFNYEDTLSGFIEMDEKDRTTELEVVDNKNVHCFNLALHIPIITFYAEKDGKRIADKELRDLFIDYEDELNNLFVINTSVSSSTSLYGYGKNYDAKLLNKTTD